MHLRTHTNITPTQLPLSPAPWRDRPVKAITLGPTGTFAEEAANKEFARGSSIQLAPTIESIYAAVENGEAPYGLVPIENSTENVVTASLDRLLVTRAKVVGERVLDVRHHLLTHCSSLDQIQTVYGHPQALAQCKRWLEANLPHVTITSTRSNAEGAQKASREDGTAAIAGYCAATAYRINPLVESIQDRSDNSTRFYVIAGTPHTDLFQTATILRAIVPNRTGGLLSLLKPLADHGINLLSLQPRPSPLKQWEYQFVIVAETNRRAPNFVRSLNNIFHNDVRVKILGGY